ncbi:ABC transporter permease [Ornithinimicrobium faecis]|uniref:ABC transporter permease n=1 Tax=Ornithinimicrobium faecis TaxID=2934158 RepID=A0ABY4YUC9_9MICO|nr:MULTISPECIES: ABC transporter permease [unclassified Ornithinimicrobium]USQ80192.1 ABC transporter permease [Ornithinimicrobium sp. HY1793]
MTSLGAALHVEARKALAARVMRTSTALLVIGIAVLAGALVGAASAGNEQILGQLGPSADESGWPLLSGLTAQITAVASVLGFGIGLSWLFGREFSEGTITGLFALPTSRPTIALAKLLIYLGWVVLVAVTLTLLVLAAGWILEMGTLDSTVLDQLGRQFVLTVLSGLLAVPAAWAATLGRGLLAGIATTLGVIITAQVCAIAAPAVAGWLPLSAPALWAMQPDVSHGWHLVPVAVIPIVFGTLTAVAWKRLQLDR